MAFRLQTGTALEETDHTFAFAMRGSDLVAVKKSNTGSGSTEVHILSGSSTYQQFSLQVGTPLPETDDTFAFAMRGSDLVAIKKRNTGSGSTEVHILSAASNYQQFALQVGTPLHETDDTFDFVMRGDDLVAIKKRNTGSGRTEVHILSGASNYQNFALQTATALHETDDTFAFAMMGNDLVAVKKSNCGTCTTEVHRLDGGSNYTAFNLETGTVLHETDATFAFATRGSDLVAIKKSGTATNSTEVHILDLTGFATVPVPFNPPLQEIAFDVRECAFGWRAAFLQAGTAVTVRIRLNFDVAIPAAMRTTLMDRWRTGILNEWSNRFACCFEPCCGTKGGVTFDVIWTNVNPHHTVRVRVGPGTSNSALWDTEDTGAVAAHEFGHLIGYPDEYASPQCPARNPVSTGTVMDDNAGMVQRLIEPFCNRHNLRTSTV
jgi:hypothetical protein